MAIDSKFLTHIEKMFPRDIDAHNDEKLHNHGSSTVKYGRGAVLTVDLTNRCNMMCDPCFMDANQVGFVHELSMDEIKEILDNAITIKPRRQMSVQFQVASRQSLRTSSKRSNIHAKSVTTACRQRRTESSLPRAKSFAGKLLKLVCVTFTCNSTESATMPTATARSAISST